MTLYYNQNLNLLYLMFDNQPNPDPKSNSNSNSNPHPKLQKKDKLPHINDEIERREISEARLDDTELQRSLLESSWNAPKPIKRKVWDAQMTVSLITLRNNERYKVLFAQNDKNCGAKNRLFGQIGKRWVLDWKQQ